MKIADKSAARQLARISERERSGTELGQPGVPEDGKPGPAAETYTLACISTGHLTERTAKWLEDNGGYSCGPLVSMFEEGFFVSCLVGGPAEHEDLEGIRSWARGHGYGYVMLDRDASKVDGLPSYDW